MRFKEYNCSVGTECRYPGFGNEPCEYCGIPYKDTVTVWTNAYLTIPYWLRQEIKPHTWTRRIRYFWQRRTRGFDNSDLYCLKASCARFMAPRIRAFIDTYGGRSTPMDLSQEEWLKILEEIQYAFQAIVDSDSALYMLSNDEQLRVDEGLDLFRQWFHDLWD